MRNFAPLGQFTGIGSLPHNDAEQAVQFVADLCPTIPFWPQLPQRCPEESMIVQMLWPLLGLLEQRSMARFEIKPGALGEFRKRLRESSPTLDERSAAGFYAFERACLANRFAQAAALKGQITGPITLAHCLFVDERPLATLPEVYAELADYLCRLGQWQIARLQQFGKPVLIFIDEPALNLGTSSTPLIDRLQELVNALKAEEAYIGIHCCATPTPTLICGVDPDIISFDAYQDLEGFLSHPQVHTFIERGGWLAFGLIPTLDDLSNFAVSEAFFRLTTATVGESSLVQLATQSLVTATCGLGLLSVESARMSFTKCGELSQLIFKALTADVR